MFNYTKKLKNRKRKSTGRKKFMTSLSEISNELKNSLSFLENALQNENQELAKNAWIIYIQAKKKLRKFLTINNLDKKAEGINQLACSFESELKQFKLALDHTLEGTYLKQLKHNIRALQQNSRQFFLIMDQIRQFQEKI
jgi:hypothetical protein